MLETSLHLKGVRVLEVVEDSAETLTVRVAAGGGWSSCPGCEAVCLRVRGYRRQRVRDLPTRGQETVLEWVRRRFECEACGSTHAKSQQSQVAVPGLGNGRLSGDLRWGSCCRSLIASS